MRIHSDKLNPTNKRMKKVLFFLGLFLFATEALISQSELSATYWIQFKDKAEYAEKEQELLETLKGYAGVSAVVIYLKDVNAMKRLPAGYHARISDSLTGELRKKYGESNVKVVERVLKNF